MNAVIIGLSAAGLSCLDALLKFSPRLTSPQYQKKNIPRTADVCLPTISVGLSGRNR